MSPGVNATNISEDFSGPQYPMDTVNLRKTSNDRNITLADLSEVGNKSFNRASVIVLGISLSDERGIEIGKNSEISKNIILGTVCVEKNTKITLTDLRRLIDTDIPCLPLLYCFLSSKGLPISRSCENRIYAGLVINEQNIVSIKRHFDKPRVGIVSAAGSPYGFIFIELTWDIRQLRDAIEQQLRLGQILKSEYRFIDRNGWPVTTSQETSLSLTDVLEGHIVHIEKNENGKNSSVPVRPVSIPIASNVLPEGSTPSQEVPEEEHTKRKISFKILSTNKQDGQLSVKAGKDGEKRPRPGKGDLVKPILISYVRAEAAQYALDLKRELVRMGFSVYLDVHEIKTGTDWQDALNFAVTHCFLFIPLITPMYGRTQWTNREVKLADVLGKTIIPVNFMDSWPPPCLAIQFASTQYIPWKFPDSDHVKTELEKSGPKDWETVYIKRVAKQIAESYKENYHKWPKSSPTTNKEITAVNRSLYSTSFDDYAFAYDMCDETKNIVISAHPKQKLLAQSLQTLFEKEGHQVWCSIDCQGTQDSFNLEEKNSNPTTPRDLPTITEEALALEDDNVFCTFRDSKKSTSHYKEPEGHGRRPLSRLMSQFSDISQPCTLSNEKLERLKTFQQKVDQAGVVIVLVSEEYTKSTFSHEQVFYCEHRKRVVLVKCDTAEVPKWFRLLMGNDMIRKFNNPQFECVLKAKVKRALNPASSETPKDATFEAKINYLVSFLKKNLPLQDMCVYVTGSSKLQTQRAEDICRAIGTELSKMERISLVTGGYFGAGDITAKTFCGCHESGCKVNSEDSPVVHILPMYESEDLTSKAHQNPDGTFETMSYGKTVFLGDSVKEKETVVARLLDMCVVIEGGLGVVHEVEEFIWNDHFVIPIISTGGAAGGKYGIPVKIFEVPPGVEANDWSVLSDMNASPEDVAKAVVKIMISLKKSLSSPTSTLKSPPFKKSKKKSKSKKYKVQETEAKELKGLSAVTSNIETGSKSRFEFNIEGPEASLHSRTHLTSEIKRRRWWHRFLNIFQK